MIHIYIFSNFTIKKFLIYKKVNVNYLNLLIETLFLYNIIYLVLFLFLLYMM